MASSVRGRRCRARSRSTAPTSRAGCSSRPGITGLWQVSGRSDLDWDDSVRLDLYYVENWSFLDDVVILARTIPSVLRSRGAY